MRFIADGVDLPNELLWAHDQGRVVFVCGAGVSRARAGLPNFDELTEKVLNGLRADESEEAFRLHRAIRKAEASAEIKGLYSVDHIFQLLERSFPNVDITSQVACALAPQGTDVDLSAHRTLLKLSKDQSGTIRLITTNFDRLFEQCDRKLPTVTRSNLPSMTAATAGWGIVHLHGCVNADYSGSTEDGFVLSSASFGDAYLAMGWAREFVKAVLEKYVVVFVGYSADDPPVRYLLQGLQLSNSAPHQIYAFQSRSDEAAIAAWRDKNVTPLCYETTVGCGHRALWETLEHWSMRAEDPKRWRSRVLARARAGPRALTPHERGMVAHIVSDAEGAAALASKQPLLPAEWLCVFDRGVRYGKPNPAGGVAGDGPAIDPFDLYRLDGDLRPRVERGGPDGSNRIPEQAWSALDPSQADCQAVTPAQVARISGSRAVVQADLPDRTGRLAFWIVRAWRDPAAAWWAGRQEAIHDGIVDRIRRELDRKPTRNAKPAVRKAWRAYLEYVDLKSGRDRAWLLERRIGRTGWSEAVADDYATCFGPWLVLDSISRGPVPPGSQSKLNSRDLVSVTTVYENRIDRIEVPDEYLETVVRKLRVELERAEDIEQRYGSLMFISAIEADDEVEGDSSFDRSYKLSGRVLAFAGLFKRLTERSPQLARAELQTWPLQSVVFTHIRIWALGKLTFAPASEFAATLLTLDRARFWWRRGQRDLLLGLAKRWPEFDLHERRRLEHRIRVGPPRWKGIDPEEHAPRKAGAVLSWLHWLQGHGCEFTFDLQAVTEKLRGTAPQWQPSHADRAVESLDGRSGWVRTDTDYSSIETLPPEQILAYLQEQERAPRRPFVEADPFRGLSKERPELALQALIRGSAEVRFGAFYWNTFLQTDRQASDDPEFPAKVLDALLSLPDSDFAEIVYAASEWFKQITSHSWFSSQPKCEELWSKCVRVLGKCEEGDPSDADHQARPAQRTRDWQSDAIASAAGRLTELIVKVLPDEVSDARSTGIAPWFRKLEELLKLPGDSRRYTLVIVCQHLDWFFAVDRAWTTQHVLAVLSQQPEPNPDHEALWAGFYMCPQAGPALFAQLKPHLLALTKAGSDPDQRHSERLAGIILASWRPREEGTGLTSDEEIRTAILEADDEFRYFLLWTLRRWSYDHEVWGPDHIVEFLSEAWPKQKRAKTDRTSANLIDLALSLTTGFREVAQVVLQLIARAHDARYAIISGLSELEEVPAGRHPREVLDLLYAFLPDRRACWPYSATEALQFLKAHHPSICKDPKFIELDGRP
ncbi:MAG: SIR2 family protein [Chloroflexota bacterium]|nr:SIR2 family protein [Chloroflexota bacterium]